MRVLCIGDIVGKPGRRAVPGSCPACEVSSHSTTSSPTARTPPPAAASPSRRRRRSSRRASTSSRPAITSGTRRRSSRTSTATCRSCGPRTIRRAFRAAASARFGGLTVIQPDGPHLHVRDRRPVPVRRPPARGRAAGVAASSSTCTRRRRARRSPWAGTWTGACPPSSARTRTSRPPTSASCRRARPSSATSGCAARATAIIGVEPEPVIRKFLTGMPARFTVAEKSQGVAVQLRARRHRRCNGTSALD